MITWGQLESGCCILLGIVHTMLGVAVLVGGETRFPPPNYTPLLEVANGKVWPYGAVWVAGGLAMIFARGGWRLLGIVIVVVISNLWAGLFFYATLKSPFASYTPTAAYGGYGLLNAALFAVMWTHRRRENEDT